MEFVAKLIKKLRLYMV